MNGDSVAAACISNAEDFSLTLSLSQTNCNTRRLHSSFVLHQPLVGNTFLHVLSAYDVIVFVQWPWSSELLFFAQGCCVGSMK